MKTLYLAWQDPENRRWLPVGRLNFDGCVYRFVYTRGAKQSPRFVPLGPMRDLHVAYESHELFPLFANRLLAKTRPEYKDFLHWLNLPDNEADPLVLLAQTEGMRATDAFMVFPCLETRSDGKYHVRFFSHVSDICCLLLSSSLTTSSIHPHGFFSCLTPRIRMIHLR